jgi:hypothetical protein
VSAGRVKEMSAASGHQSCRLGRCIAFEQKLSCFDGASSWKQCVHGPYAQRGRYEEKRSMATKSTHEGFQDVSTLLTD